MIDDRRARLLAHRVAVAGLAGVWLYQGVVPKLVLADADEVALWRQSLGLDEAAATAAVRAAGVAEVVAAVMTVRLRHRRWPFIATAVAMPVLAASAAVADPRSFGRAFNPASLNTAIAALAVVAAVTVEAEA